MLGSLGKVSNADREPGAGKGAKACVAGVANVPHDDSWQGHPTVPGGSWVLISREMSTLRRVIGIATILITLLITTHEPPSKQPQTSTLNPASSTCNMLGLDMSLRSEAPVSSKAQTRHTKEVCASAGFDAT